MMNNEELQFTVGQDSNIGLQRTENQDALGWFSTPDGDLFVVADGMGGTAGGRIAADMVVSALRQAFEQGSGSYAELLRQGIEDANQQVLDRAGQEKELSDMGSTVVAMAYQKGLAYIAHTGDSRLYLIRRGCITRLTKDHSRVQELIDAGRLTETEAEHHPEAHVITRCIGGDSTLIADVRSTPVACHPGDTFLFCTDGLSGLVTDKEMEEIVAHRQGSPSDTCRELVKLALDRGGYDNITVQLICFAGEPAQSVPAMPKKQPRLVTETEYIPAGKSVAVTPPPQAAEGKYSFEMSKQQLVPAIGALFFLLLVIGWFVLKPQPEPEPVPIPPNAQIPAAINTIPPLPVMPSRAVLPGAVPDGQVRETGPETILHAGMEVEVEIIGNISEDQVKAKMVTIPATGKKKLAPPAVEKEEKENE